MTSLAWLCLGFFTCALFGIAHHFALQTMRQATPRQGRESQAVIILTFVALLLLHLVEIAGLALLNLGLVTITRGGTEGQAWSDWSDVLYVTGTNYTTLGHTQIELVRPIRFVLVSQSVLGFLLLTWSATYLYSVCIRTWQSKQND